MKNLYLLLLTLFLMVFQSSHSQEITGIATYKFFLKTDIKLDSTQVNAEMRARIEEMVRKQTRKEYELHFNNNESFFIEKESLEKPGNNMFSSTVVSSIGGLGSLYKNKSNNQFIKQAEILGKQFLVVDTLQKQEWVLEKETKNIGEYVCFKATRIEVTTDKETGGIKEINTIAWYTPQIPVAFGPMDYGGLPGLILEVQRENVSYLCNQIVLNPKKGIKMEPAKKGTKVSEKEFEAIKAKKQKEMGEDSNSKTGVEVKVEVRKG
jgi:GLPGLI family protein